jgi:[NiFe] hydrogenase assembly HybE family chaperone
MKDIQKIAKTVEESYQKIYDENMRDVPIINSCIKIESRGFSLFEKRIIGVIITPWMANLIILPIKNENWQKYEIGKKKTFTFADKSYIFIANEIENIGVCFALSLHSPMFVFKSHEQVIESVDSYLKTFKKKQKLKTQIDENLLGKVLRGEKTPDINLDDFASIEPVKVKTYNTVTKKRLKTNISRRDLLLGNLQNKL